MLAALLLNQQTVPPIGRPVFGGPPWYYKWYDEDEDAIEEAEEIIEEAVQILATKPKNPVKAVAKQERDFKQILARVQEVSKREVIAVMREEVQRRIQERKEEEEEMPLILSLIWGEQ